MASVCRRPSSKAAAVDVVFFTKATTLSMKGTSHDLAESGSTMKSIRVEGRLAAGKVKSTKKEDDDEDHGEAKPRRSFFSRSLTQISGRVKHCHVGAADDGIGDLCVVGHLADEHGVREKRVDGEFAEDKNVEGGREGVRGRGGGVVGGRRLESPEEVHVVDDQQGSSRNYGPAARSRGY